MVAGHYDFAFVIVDRNDAFFRDTCILGEEARSGRPRKSTKREDRTLVRKSLADRHLTNPPLKAEWELSTGVDVSTRTVRRRLCENGLKGCRAREKPLVAQAQTQKLDCCPMAKSTVLR